MQNFSTKPPTLRQLGFSGISKDKDLGPNGPQGLVNLKWSSALDIIVSFTTKTVEEEV